MVTALPLAACSDATASSFSLLASVQLWYLQDKRAVMVTVWKAHALHRGNGFCTDAKVLAKVPGASNAATFFNSVMSKPYLNQIVLAPHLYCPMVWHLLHKCCSRIEQEGLQSMFVPSLSMSSLNEEGKLHANAPQGILDSSKHPKGAQVSGAKTAYKPSNGQFQVYNTTFGYLTVPPGYCGAGSCHVFPAINDEFG